jgi:hypothetical protein
MTTHTHDYAVAPHELLAVLVDPAYLQARNERFAGVGDPSAVTEADTVVVTVVRQLPMDKIPGPVKGMVGDGRITQVDTWMRTSTTDGAVTGSWKADLGSSPATIGGEYRIEATDVGSRYSCTVDVTVKVPFIGGKIEEQVRGYLDRLVTKEQEFLADWMSQH